MIEKMTKYSFILLSGKTEEFLRRLQELGLVDITRSSKPVDERSAALLSMTNELKTAIWVPRSEIQLQWDSMSLTNEMMRMFKEGRDEELLRYPKV